MKLLTRFAESRLPTRFGEFQCIVYQTSSKAEHLALIKGPLRSDKEVLCRIHSECLTGESFSSLRCDCKQQLDRGLRAIQQAESGVLIYLRQEGRGIGLGNKIRAYALQDQGLDTVDANLHLGFADDARSYQEAAYILQDLGIKSVLLMTNNPGKLKALENAGIGAKRKNHVLEPISQEARDYLSTKQKRMGHLA